MPKANTASRDDAKLVTIEKAASLICKSPHSVRQLLMRGQIQKEKVGHSVLVNLNSVLTYHARKKGFPSWEENIEKIKNLSFVSLQYTSQSLMVQPSYILRLVKNKQLEGYVTAAGDIMISRNSINAYLRKPDADTKSL